MLRNSIAFPAALAAILLSSPAFAQANGTNHRLHVNPRWDECSFQLDGSLSQSAFRQFSEEAGLVTYFRSLNDARPMGKGSFELSVLQWKTGIDNDDSAWNDTFVHPDSTHELFEGSGLQFPGLMMRAGVGSRTDVGLYVTKNPKANYGFVGAQVQRNLVNNTERNISAAARLSAVSLYGPEDVDFAVLGADFIVSWQKQLTGKVSVSPYVSVSSYMTRAHEKSNAVTLKDEIVGASQASIGAALNVSMLRLAAEYNAASVNTLSLKIGLGR